MNSTPKYKFLQHVSSKLANGGFTLVELLVVVIIVGILAAIAMPNLLNQIGKARQTEGEIAIGTFFRAQKAFHFERSTFETSIMSTDELETPNPLGITIELKVYSGGTISSSADETTITLGNPAVTVDQGVRLLEGELEYENGGFLEVICQSVSVSNPLPPSADPSTPSGIPSCGANGETIN